jgi:hypothetical protein
LSERTMIQLLINQVSRRFGQTSIPNIGVSHWQKIAGSGY